MISSMAELDPALVAEVEDRLKAFGDPTHPLHDEVCETFDRLQIEWEKRLQPLREAIAASERITAEDLAIVINTRE